MYACEHFFLKKSSNLIGHLNKNRNRTKTVEVSFSQVKSKIVSKPQINFPPEFYIYTHYTGKDKTNPVKAIGVKQVILYSICLINI